MTDRMTLQDQLAINAAQAIVLTVVSESARETMQLAILREALSGMAPGRKRLDPFIAAAHELIGAAVARERGGPAWNRAIWEVKAALVDIAEWRMGEIQTRLAEKEQAA